MEAQLLLFCCFSSTLEYNDHNELPLYWWKPELHPPTHPLFWGVCEVEDNYIYVNISINYKKNLFWFIKIPDWL